MAIRILLPLLVMIVSFSSFTLLLEDWKLKKDKNGIKVYTRSVEGWKLKEYKAQMDVNTTLEKARALIMDVPSYVNWQHNCGEATVLESQNGMPVSAYILTKAPWPATDRDLVVEFKEKPVSNGTLVINFNAVEGGAPEKDGRVRITYMKGFWNLKEMSNGQIRITQQVHADPAGKLPDWLTNSAVVDTPYKTMLNMKEMLE